MDDLPLFFRNQPIGLFTLIEGVNCTLKINYLVKRTCKTPAIRLSSLLSGWAPTVLTTDEERVKIGH